MITGYRERAIQGNTQDLVLSNNHDHIKPDIVEGYTPSWSSSRIPSLILELSSGATTLHFSVQHGEHEPYQFLKGHSWDDCRRLRLERQLAQGLKSPAQLSLLPPPNRPACRLCSARGGIKPWHRLENIPPCKIPTKMS